MVIPRLVACCARYQYFHSTCIKTINIVNTDKSHEVYCFMSWTHYSLLIYWLLVISLLKSQKSIHTFWSSAWAVIINYWHCCCRTECKQKHGTTSFLRLPVEQSWIDLFSQDEMHKATKIRLASSSFFLTWRKLLCCLIFLDRPCQLEKQVRLISIYQDWIAMLIG